MPKFFYKTNGEEVKCVNCGFQDFTKLAAVDDGDGRMLVPYECGRCHFVSWFPQQYAPDMKAES